jgi:Zn finger protein HypA/HybF involved in hydrogenase expression
MADNKEIKHSLYCDNCNTSFDVLVHEYDGDVDVHCCPFCQSTSIVDDDDDDDNDIV